MRRHSRILRIDGPALAAVLACAVLWPWPAATRAAVPLYEVVVPLGGPAAEDRSRALVEALQGAVVKASGRRGAATIPAVAAANPERYVQRYSKMADQMLKVGFDGRAIEDLLQKAGLPVWASERPLTVVTADGVDRAEIERAAAWRGLPIAWGPAAAVAGSTARAALTGVTGGSGIAWRFVHAGRTVEVQGSAQAGIDLAADTLAAWYAPPSTRALSEVAIRVGGIGDFGAYAALLAHLKSLSLVRAVAVVELAGDVVHLVVTMRGDAELLGRIAALDARLVPASLVDGPTVPADFLFRP
jgi:hypothetical protein